MDDLIKPNILFLLVDSFRADKCYGKEKTSVTPNLDSLIEKEPDEFRDLEEEKLVEAELKKLGYLQ